MKVTKKPQAIIDLIETADYIARDDPRPLNVFLMLLTKQ